MLQMRFGYTPVTGHLCFAMFMITNDDYRLLDYFIYYDN